jgi:O-antigen ligase
VPTRGQLWLLLGLGVFAGWAALSALWSPDSGASLREAERSLVYVAAIAAAVAIGGRLLAGTLAGVAVVCAYSVGQRLLQGPPDPPDPFEGTLLQEPLGYANALGGMAAIGLVVAIVLALRYRPRAVPLALGVLFLVTLALTESRGGWLAALAGTAVAVPLALGRRRLALAAAGAAGFALVVALAVPAGSLADEAAARGGDRAWYWHVAWEEAAAAPVVGRGAGSFELAWLERQPVPVSVRDAHSLYLETLAELGLVGLCLLLLALAPPLVAAFRGASAAAAGGYVAFLFHAGVDWDWELPALTLAGLLCGAATLQRPTQDSAAPDVSMRSKP